MKKNKRICPRLWRSRYADAADAGRSVCSVKPALAALPVLSVTFLQAFCSVKAGAPEPSAVPKPGELWLALLSHVFSLAFAVLVSRLFSDGWREVPFKRPRYSFRRALGRGILYGVGATLLVLGFAWSLQQLCDACGCAAPRQEVFDWLCDATLPLPLRVFLAATAVLVAPVLEEWAYRGVLFREAARGAKGWVSPALVAALYFSLMHLNAFAFLPLLLFGFCTTAAYRRTRTLATPVAMHVFFNAASLALWFSLPEH